MSETRQLVTTHNKQDELFLFIRNNHYKQKYLDWIKMPNCIKTYSFLKDTTSQDVKLFAWSDLV